MTDAVSSGNTGGFVDGNANPALADYEYDQNGNMILDRNKGIQSISYNHLNLPTEIIFDNTHKINYLYNSAGVKIQKKVTNGTTIKTVDYLDGFQYAGNVLQFFPTAEGYVKATKVQNSYSFDYVFNYTDHLGNIRLSYTKNPENGVLEILDETHYYPFGLKHEVYVPATKQSFRAIGSFGETALTNVTETDYQYKYQGQELQDELGLNWYSFKWRNYMPDIGRFFNVDPLTEKYSYQSHYNFSENVVINSRELEGLERKIAIVLGRENTTEFDSNLRALGKQGYETSKVTTGQELISNILQMKGGEELERVVILSHGYDGGLIGGNYNTGVYTDRGFYENAGGSDLPDIAPMRTNGARTSTELGKALTQVGFTENAEIVLGGCNLGLSSEVVSYRGGDSGTASTQIGGFAGDLAKSTGVPVIASSPRIVNPNSNSSYQVSGLTQPFPTNSNSTAQRETSGSWFKFNKNGTEEKQQSKKINLSSE